MPIIETLVRLPDLIKNDDKYEYPEKFIGKAFLYNDNYLIFKKSSYDTINRGIIEKLVESEIEQKMEQLIRYENRIINLNTKLDEITEVLNDKIDSQDLINTKMSLEEEISNLKNSPNTKSNDAKLIIERQKNKDYVDEQVEIIYNNMKSTIEEVISNTLKKSNVTSSDKMSLGTLFALKESGYTSQEIIDLKNSGVL